MTSSAPRRELRNMLVPGAAVLLPGVSNALAARVVADLGFAAAYVTGAGIANTFLGIPDNGLVTLTELAEHVAAIRDIFPGPLMVDADTGFGNAVNAMRSVKVLERAGTDAIATDGFAAALERASAYREAGADATFVEAPQSIEQIAEIPRRLPWPQV